MLDSIETANSDVAARLSVLQNERDVRLIMLKNNRTGPIANAGQIRDYIASIDPKGKKSLDFKKIRKMVQLMRGIRLSKKTDSPGGGTANERMC